MKDRYFSSSVGRLHYRYSDGNSIQTIVLLHGFAASSLSWARFIEKLPDTIGVVAPDLLGHGLSEAPEIEFNISNQAKAVEELIASLNARNIAIMGHSYGGWIAATIAQKGLCNYLILEDSAGLDIMDDERLSSDPDFMEKFIKQALATNPNERVLRSIMYSRKQSDYLTPGTLSSISMPTLIVWGNQDIIVPVKFAYAFNSRIKNSELFILHGAKHTPHYTNPKEIADKVISFLAQSKKILK